MEKSNSKTSLNHGSGDERGNQNEDEQATTSRGDTFSPEQISHNMKDLKALDFNSADEIRQAMKAILAGKTPPQPFSEEPRNYPDLAPQTNAEPIKINDLLHQKIQSRRGPEVPKHVPGRLKQNLYQRLKNSAQAWACKPNYGYEPPRRKRQATKTPKAGPSKKMRKNVSSMYLGKLSNVVRFQRRYESESESDVESVVIFY